MTRTRTTLVMAAIGASLAFAPLGVAEPKDKASPPGAVKPPKENKKVAKGEQKAEEKSDKGAGHGQSKKGPLTPGAPDPASDDEAAGKSPDHPGGHGDARPGKDGQRWSELVKKEKDGTLTEAEKSELDAMRAHPTLARGGAARKARTNELEQKQASGTLTDEEKGELEELQRKQARIKELDNKHAKRKADREKRRLESKREALSRFPGYAKNAPARDEFQKHASRLAKLRRAKDLATAEERTELVARIDELITKENARHEKWMTKHTATAARGGTP